MTMRGQWHDWFLMGNDFSGQQAENPGTVAPTQPPQRKRARGSGSASQGFETPSQPLHPPGKGGQSAIDERSRVPRNPALGKAASCHC